MKLINVSTGAAEKNSVKQIQSFAEVYIVWGFTPLYGNESYLDVNKTEIWISKAKDNIGWYNFYLGSASWDFTKGERREISLNGTVYDFSVDHN